MRSDEEGTSRNRVSRLFQFVRALNELRNPVPRQVRELDWSLSLNDLPNHDCVTLGTAPKAVQEGDEGAEAPSDFVLRVKRPPPLPPVAPPPHEIADWVSDGWQRYEATLSVIETRHRDDEAKPVERFDEDSERVAALQRWSAAREDLISRNMPALKAFRLFERLYTLHGTMERDAERYDVVLGDGILCWNVPKGSIRFPIVLQKLELEFDPSVPSFTLTDASAPTEFYSTLFRTIDGIDGNFVADIKKELEAGQYHPLSADDLTALLASIPPRLSANGQFVTEAPLRETSEPVLYRTPIIFLRKRTLGLGEALERIVADIMGDGDIPQSLINIIGDGTLAASSSITDERAFAWESEHSDVLFTKSANAEQYRIAEALATHSCVLVQGPPGTGKTHTIANLLGHLLAEGKSVLVTSSTTKALRVLREKVVEKLRPLCVSVLESDSQSNDQLKAAVDSIVERLGSTTEPGLLRDADRLDKDRQLLIKQVNETRQMLLQGRDTDTQPIVVGSEKYDPLEAARIVARGKNEHAWIPMPVASGSLLPASPEELRALYRTNATVPTSIENELAQTLPNPNHLLQPSEFEIILNDLREIDSFNAVDEEYWNSDLDASSQSLVQSIAASLVTIMQPWLNADDWLFAVAHDGARGGGHLDAWLSLIEMVGALENLAETSREPFARFGPSLAEGVEVQEQRKILNELLIHLKSGGSLNFFSLLLKPGWKTTIQGAKVNGRSPKSADEVAALHLLASLECERAILLARWNRQVEQTGGPALAGSNPEELAARHLKSVSAALEWSDRELRPLRDGAIAQGFDWNRSLREALIPDEQQAEFRAEVRLCRDILPRALAARLRQFASAQHNEAILELQNTLSKFSSDTNDRLLTAVRVRSAEMYSSAFKALIQLYESMEELRTRRDILSKLSSGAPAWADAVAKRHPPHDRDTLPNDVENAWLWVQAAQQLRERDAIPVEALQADLHKKTRSLEQKTAELADARAWLAQRRRTGLAEQQALIGWQQTVKKIGKGTGKRAPVLRKLARDLMERAKTAVPVWIMPMIRVAENYDPRTTRFDVIIIDEASQCDVTGLMALYFGKQVVVVGDDEQVSPEAVGQRLDETQHLINEYLYGIPNDQLYDGKSSIYDLAKQAFGGTISLREHFRCVPDIIQFSNHLSYEDKLIPLREASQSNLLPHVVAHRVLGTSDNKTNQEEAAEIVALISAFLEEPEYDGKTIGVISLVGEDQAALIETQLRQRIEPKVLEDRRLLCGNSAHFQGDERDVIFLSMIDSSTGAPLRMRNDAMFKKRFNVAASRARDQMWVVYSVDPADLQTGDLRKRLIEHAMNPKALAVKIETELGKAESDFEKDVLRRLITAGYSVKPQYVIGPYRIDIMVEGTSQRLAVECDGEQYHTILELQHDMERQSQLERVGLTFYRIRGSRYYRDRDEEFNRLVDRLSEMGIMPGSAHNEATPSSELLDRVKRRAADIRATSIVSDDLAFYERQWVSRTNISLDAIITPTEKSGPASATESAVEPPGHEDIPEIAPAHLSVEVPPVQEPHIVTRDQPISNSQNGQSATDGAAIELLVSAGVSRDDIIDKRDHERGSLWVVADASRAALFESLARKGIQFHFAPEGGRATGHRAAWWTRYTDNT